MGFQIGRQSAFAYRPEDLKLGELLVAAGIITQAQLLQTLNAQGNSRTPTGQLLIMRGLITPHVLQAAVEAQSAIKDGVAGMPLAIECLKTAWRANRDFAEVLAQHRSPIDNSETNRLGKLLVDAEVISESQLHNALTTSRSSGLPLGRVLELKKLLNEPVLAAALEMQVRLRDQMIDREEAIDSLRLLLRVEGKANDKTGAQSVSSGGDIPPPPPATQSLAINLSAPATPRTIRTEADRTHNLPAIDSTTVPGGRALSNFARLGELLVASGLLTITDVMAAVETALTRNRPLGQVLVETGVLPDDVLNVVLVAQKGVSEGSIKYEQAAHLLACVHAGQLDPGAALAKLTQQKPQTPRSLDFHQFLVLCNIVTEEDLTRVAQLHSVSRNLSHIALVSQGIIDEETLNRAELCYLLYVNGVITQEEAIVLQNLLLRQDTGAVNLETALIEIRSACGTMFGAEQKAKPVVQQPQIKPRSELRQKLDQSKQLAGWLQNIQDPSVNVTKPVNRISTNQQFLGTIDLPLSEQESEWLRGDPRFSPSPQNAAIENNQHSIDFQTQTSTKLESLVEHAGLEIDKFEPEAKPDTKSGFLWQSFIRTAETYVKHGQYQKAQQYYEYVIGLKERELNPNHPALVDDLGDLASILCLEEKLSEAETIIRRMLGILLEMQSPDRIKLADTWSALARIYFRMGLFDLSETAILHALELRRETLGEGHPAVGKDLRDYARILRKLNLHEKAEKVYAHARSLIAHSHSPQPPS